MRVVGEYVEASLAAQGRQLMADPGKLKDDLVRDMVEVLTSFCVQLCGRCSARNRTKAK